MKIFLAGGDGAGKSTTAKHLQEHIKICKDKVLPVLAFGNLVRSHIANSQGISYKELKDKPTPIHIRTLLRSEGERLRGKNPYHWVQQFQFLYEDVEGYIVDDLRFKEEALYAVAVDGFLVYLECENRENDSTFKDLDEVRKLAHMVIPSPKDITPKQLATNILVRYLKWHRPVEKPNYQFVPLPPILQNVGRG